jgi:hypothetical protein
MSEVHITKCDECEIFKKDTNGWFFVAKLKDNINLIIGHGENIGAIPILMTPTKILDVCGEPCLIKLISRLLEKV